MEIGQKVKELRKNLNLTQKDFSEKIGVSVKTIVFWESGENEPSKSNLFTICNKCNLPLNYFEEIKQNVNKNVSFLEDIIKIPYWSELPEELKHPEYPYVLAQRVSIEKGWNVRPENLCIVPMVGDKLSKYWYPINDGDILIIDTSHNYIRGNGVYFATSRNNTRFWVREMQVLVNDDLEIKGFSPSGNNTRVLTRKELEEVDFKVIGKVIKNVSFRL